MRPQEKTAPTPAPAPGERPALSEVAAPQPGGGRKRWLWALPGVVAVLAAGAYYLLVLRQAPRPAAGAAGGAPAQVRTAKVFLGNLERSIRLTGSTAAQNFAALVAPQMRGARHGVGESSIARSTTVSVPSAARRSSGSGGSSAFSSSSSSSGGSSGGSGGSESGTGGGSSRGGSESVRSSTSRFGSSGGSSGSDRGSSGGGGGSVGTRSTSQRGDRGSAGGSGGGSSGGSRGPASMGDYQMVLQTVVPPGSRVKKGDVVAEFDRQYMLTRLDDYRASVQQVESSLGILKANLEVDKKAHQQTILVAKSDLDKAQIDLKTLPVRSEIDSELLRLREEEAAARYKQYLSEVKHKEISHAAQWRIGELERGESKIELARAEANAERMLVRAPMDGITVMTQTLRGDQFGQIQQGDNVFAGMMFMRIVDPDSMIVNATINQADSERLRIGAKARVRFDAYPDLELPAHVYSIAAMPRSGGFRGTYVKEVPLVLKLDKLDPRVIPDLSVSADVVLEREEQATVAPLEAVFRDGAQGAPFAFLRGPRGWERREVELGMANNVAVAVRSGLRPGEVVAAERPPVQAKL